MGGTRALVVTSAAVALTAGAMLLETPGALLTSIVAVLGAATIGYLSQSGPGRWRRPEPTLATTVPVSHTVRIQDHDYVTLADGDRLADVPAGGHTVRLAVTGLSPVPVLLTGLRAEVLSRSGATGELSRHAAAAPPVRHFEVRLDERPPRVRALGETDFPVRLDHHETEVFDLAVLTDSGDVRWRLWLGWSCGTRTGDVRVDLAGQPFRTAARHGIPG
ncbi:hypothetical protein GCM10010168_89250 [Actinoplanes ianthinogenes]|uniref:Uncharacterized protein n=1 Tax=Actinoplanes ianthinogenes TaxID=122358 RepID=A0ABM7LQ15_9ACTN|nr:hypothetical protein [Actinoplanes ianthinogenes]BCJ41315.1 hypothetical protein Aiant_19720 [Actinoplanes ianthinogenes]GGR56450.1 hypothetical protein GCM10010168_89250 [Actinoplanes ianthinogenes]